MKQGKETALVRDCLQYLHTKGIMAWRNNVGSMKVDKRFVRFGQPGSADILGILPPDGRLLAVECKVGSNKLTDLQRAWLKDIQINGGLAIVAYSLDDLMSVI